ncbi:MAG: KEOPS complex subunit Pcc1 [Candidatus Methanoperedens sp.]
MEVLAEFEFDAGNVTRIIYEALLPELDQDYQRTRTSLVLKDDALVLKVEANDTVSMRAALNGWLRLIKITYEMCSLTSDTQVIN